MDEVEIEAVMAMNEALMREVFLWRRLGDVFDCLRPKPMADVTYSGVSDEASAFS